MLSYIHFLLKTFSKRISSYILVAIHLAVVCAILVVNVNHFTDNYKGISFLSYINTFMKFFPFLFASVFSILVVTHVFKESANGVEIMIVAKPITRKQIIISKFLVVFSLLLLHQFFIFISYSLLSLYDSGSSSTIRANWAISLALGGFIVQAIFVFIIILMASLVGKMGTSIIAILIAAIIPITSLIITEMSLATVSVRTYQSNPSYGNVLRINSEQNENDNRGLYLNRTYDYDFQNKTGNIAWLRYQKEKWYQDVYPFDIWYQWGRFMNLFTKDNIWNKQRSIQNLKIKESIKINQNDVFLEIGKEKNDPDYPLLKYALLLNLSKYEYKENINNKFQDLLQNYFQRAMNPDYEIKSIKDLVVKIKERFKINKTTYEWINIQEFNTKSLVRRLSQIQYQISRLKNGDGILADVPFEYKLSKILAPVVYKILSEEKSILTTPGGINLRIDNTKLKISSATFTPENDNIWNKDLKSYGLVQTYDDDKKNLLGYKIVSNPYVSTEVVVIVWLLIGTLLGGISISIFFKKDFK